MGVVIKTPRGQIVQYKTESGEVSAKLEWNESALNARAKQFDKAQVFLDSEVLRTTAPYVPFKTGSLNLSGTLGTVIGAGEVVYSAPYAAHQYYNTARSRDYDPKRGAYWFERSKADNKAAWLDGARRIAGRGD